MATTTKKQNRSESSLQSSTKGNRKRAKQKSLKADDHTYRDPHTMSAEEILEELIVFVEDYDVEPNTEFQLPAAVFCWNWYNPTNREIAEQALICLARSGKIPSVRYVSTEYFDVMAYLKADYPVFREPPDVGYYTGNVEYYNMTIDQIYSTLNSLWASDFDIGEEFILAEEFYCLDMFEPIRRRIAERKLKADTEAGETGYVLEESGNKEGKDIYRHLRTDISCSSYEDFEDEYTIAYIEDWQYYTMELQVMLAMIKEELAETADSTDKPFTLPEAIAEWNLFAMTKRKLAEERITLLVTTGKLAEHSMDVSKYKDIHVVYGEQRNGHRLFIKYPTEEFCYNMSVEAIVNTCVAQIQYNDEIANEADFFSLSEVEPRWSLFEPTRRKLAATKFKEYVLAGHIPSIKLVSTLEDPEEEDPYYYSGTLRSMRL